MAWGSLKFANRDKGTRIKQRNEYLLKYDDKLLLNKRAYLKMLEEQTEFKSLFREGEIYSLSDRVNNRRALGALRRQCLYDIISCFEKYCPIDTGNGVLNGIKYVQNSDGFRIDIGGSLAPYLVHLSYPRSPDYSKSGEFWINDAFYEARNIAKSYGFRLSKPYISYGRVMIYLNQRQ